MPEHRSLLAVVAEAAGLHQINATEPEVDKSFHERIIENWKNDASIRRQFGSVAAYAQHCEQSPERLAAVAVATTSMPAPPAPLPVQTDDQPTSSGPVVRTAQSFSFITGANKPVAGARHVESLRAKGVEVSAVDAAAIEGYAATWNRSADIRAEFRSFENFAAYMKAKTAGRVRIFGQD